MKPHKLNIFQIGDEVKCPKLLRPGKIVSMFYLPYREGCNNGAPDTYYLPELVVHDDDYEKIDPDNYLTIYYGWTYIVAHTHFRDDEIHIFHENQLKLFGDNEELVWS